MFECRLSAKGGQWSPELLRDCWAFIGYRLERCCLESLRTLGSSSKDTFEAAHRRCPSDGHGS